MRKARLIARASLAWQRARASLWFLPAVLVAAAIVLSTGLLALDARLAGRDAGAWWLFGGSASGGRTLLSVIAGSLITVVAVAFSVTMLAIQQASTQFSPRILRNFTSDRGNQLVLGAYIATFVYALLVLREIRSLEDGEVFVPAVSISVGLLLAVVCLCLLIYFIHHVSESLQVGALLSNIRRDLDHELDQLFPEQLPPAGAREVADPVARFERGCAGTEHAIGARDEGHVRIIDLGGLIAAARASDVAHLRVAVRIGDYVRAKDVVLRVWATRELDQDDEDRLRDVVQVDRDRSIQQDPSFGIRQLVDIAVKALSPGINDPTTAEQALDHLGGVMTTLLQRTIPSPLRTLDHGLVCLFDAPTFADFVDESFGQIRRAARSNLHVTVHLATLLHGLLHHAADPGRAAVLRIQLDELLEGFDRSTLTSRERDALERHRWDAAGRGYSQSGSSAA